MPQLRRRSVKVMKIGIFSGTFDPIHIGHISVAEEIIQRNMCDLIYIMPERSPRYKSHASTYRDRLAMARLATRGKPQIKIPDSEMTLIKDSSHTLKEIIPLFSKENTTELKIILGGDVFDGIHKWQDINKFARQISFIVAVDEHEQAILHQNQPYFKVEYVSRAHSSVSSTKVRQLIKQRGKCSHITSSVQDYIKDKKLFA